MKISFNKRKIETICIALAFVLIVIMTCLCILATADGIFRWDIFPPFIEKIGTLAMCAMGITIGACCLLNLMVNVSLISGSLEKIAEQLELDKKNE